MGLRVHHLNCGCLRPVGGRLMDGFSDGPTGRLTCHCLLVETERDGLVLVDTGFGRRDLKERTARISPLLATLSGIAFDAIEPAFDQVARLGFDPRDVRHIVMTHLDFDHAGGLDDFPWARVHVMADELEAAMGRRTFLERHRYVPGHFARVRDWRAYRDEGESWFGFEAVRPLDGLPPGILMVPLPGHSPGHAGVAVEGEAGWLLLAGDAYFVRHEIDRPQRDCPPGARAYQRLMAADHRLHRFNQSRVRDLAQDPAARVRIFCSHDAAEFEALRDLSSDLARAA